MWVGIAAQTSAEGMTVPWSLWGLRPRLCSATAQLMGFVPQTGVWVRPGPGCCSPSLILCGFPLQYGMVFDAGSSHTSLFVYQWDSDKENDTGVVSQTLSCDVQGQYPPAMGSVLPCASGGWGALSLRGALAVAGGPWALSKCGAPALGGLGHVDGE